ncbi:MAG: hypothetical protein MZU95_08620 [Desulfomicrobium escambiense]|nr:hypothetical protein [Desulfomicrobium escambiense]
MGNYKVAIRLYEKDEATIKLIIRRAVRQGSPGRSRCRRRPAKPKVQRFESAPRGRGRGDRREAPRRPGLRAHGAGSAQGQGSSAQRGSRAGRASAPSSSIRSRCPPSSASCGRRTSTSTPTSDVFAAVISLYEKGQKADLITLADELSLLGTAGPRPAAPATSPTSPLRHPPAGQRGVLRPDRAGDARSAGASCRLSADIDRQGPRRLRGSRA